MSETSGSVRQQIGEILGTVRALAEQMRERQADAKEEAKGLRSEIGNVKHEQRAELQIVSLRLEKAEKRQEELAEQLRDVATQLNGVTTTAATLSKGVADLQAPVTELLNIKRRSVAFVAFVASVVAVLWTLKDPVWTWVVQRFLPGAK